MKRTLPLSLSAFLCTSMLLLASVAHSATISFLVDPATIDADMSGFIEGTEFSPVGSDGTGFTMEPTNNLVGIDRFLLSATTGLRFGGGGGSTITFDFTPDQSIVLNSYTLGTTGAFLGNPIFDIREGAAVLSAANTANASGDTHAFAGGPIALDAGTTYSFVATTTGAAVQAFMESWDYTVVPEPGTALLFGFGLVHLAARRRS